MALALEKSSINGPLLLCPKLCKIFPKITGYQDFKVAYEEVAKFFQAAYQEHLETFDKDNPRDFIDAYINKMKEDEASGFQSSFAGKRGYDNLIYTMIAFFREQVLRGF